MPLARACVIVELGYSALRLFSVLRTRVGPPIAAIIASLVAAVGAGITVGFYEYFAYLAGWWRYAPAQHMIGAYCAPFIPVGEAFMFLAILSAAARMFAREHRERATDLRRSTAEIFRCPPDVFSFVGWRTDEVATSEYRLLHLQVRIQRTDCKLHLDRRHKGNRYETPQIIGCTEYGVDRGGLRAHDGKRGSGHLFRQRAAAGSL